MNKVNINTIYNSGAVRRFHTLADYSGAPTQTVADHSWGVVLFCIELYDRMVSRGTVLGPLTNILRAAAYHDVEEQFTGDIPSPTKWRFPVLRDAVDEVERGVRGELGLEWVYAALSDKERGILKWADSLELYAHCVRRERDGARAYGDVAENIRRHMLTSLPQYPEALELLNDLIGGSR